MRATTADRGGRRLRDLRISVTDRCNFRCLYCMPAEVFGDQYRFLPKSDILTFEEIERVVRAGAALGVGKLRITGGEPLLRADLAKLIAMLTPLDGIEEVSLTTNGARLAGFAPALKKAGLARVTVSLDSLDEAIFKKLSGRRSEIAPVLAGIDAAARAGLNPVKINCVVKRGTNDHGILDIARRFRGSGHIVRFIEYMDVGNLNGWNLTEVVPAQEILARIDEEFPLAPLEPNYAGEVARRYRYRDGAGEIGLVASVSRPFCGGCTRARLSCDGQVYTCLFASEGTDLRGPLRDGASDAVLREFLAGIWKGRTDRYSEERTAHTQHHDPKVEMYHIGG